MLAPARERRVARVEQRLIAELQKRGYSLAAIKDLSDRWQQGRSLADVLGVEQSAAGVLGAGAPVRITPAELAAAGYTGAPCDTPPPWSSLRP